MLSQRARRLEIAAVRRPAERSTASRTDRTIFNKADAEKAWAKLLALYKTALA